MAAFSLFQYLRLAYFSQPANERGIYGAIRKIRATRLVEIGVGMGVRSKRLVQTAQRYAGDSQVAYCGVDLFEARSSHDPGWTLKRTHRELTAIGAKVQLIPGDATMALMRSANSLAGTDLIVIGADQDFESVERVWFYMPRMLHENSRVFVAAGQADGRFLEFSFEDVSKLADAGRQQRRAA